MKKMLNIILVLIVVMVTLVVVFGCGSSVQSITEGDTIEGEKLISTEVDESGEEKAIEVVKDNLTTDIVGSWRAVKYEGGYVVNFDDMAYWYIESGKVWSLNGFAKTYAENTEYEYDIPWEDLF